jgi:hypothetical protein
MCPLWWGSVLQSLIRFERGWNRALSKGFDWGIQSRGVSRRAYLLNYVFERG